MTGERHDRTGEVIEDEPCGCDGGWIDRDADKPIPCTTCKPHLSRAALERAAHGHGGPR